MRERKGGRAWEPDGSLRGRERNGRGRAGGKHRGEGQRGQARGRRGAGAGQVRGKARESRMEMVAQRMGEGKGTEECGPREGQKESRAFCVRLCIHLCAKNVLTSLTKGQAHSLPVTTSRRARLVNTGKPKRGPTPSPNEGEHESTGLARFNPKGKQQKRRGSGDGLVPEQPVSGDNRPMRGERVQPH